MSRTTFPHRPYRQIDELNVLVVAESQVARFGVEAMLASLPIVGYQKSCKDSSEVAEQVHTGRFHVLILSTTLGHTQCHALAAEAALLEVKVLLLLDSSAAQDATRAGSLRSDGYLFQDELTLATLDDALSRVMRGEMPMPSKLARELLTHASRKEPGSLPRPVSLTPREQQTLAMLAEGMSNKQIARRLGISEHGTKRHVANVLAKLNCPNRTLAAALAIQEGMLAEA